MIQFNLIPDVKKEYIKVKRQRRLITSISTLAIVISIGVVVLLYSAVQFGQKTHIKNLTEDIKQDTAKLESIPDLDKMLTIQNQLNSVPELHKKKPEISRIFNYLNQVTPIEVKINKVSVNVIDSTMQIEGTADTLATVNVYADTLKFVKYKTSDDIEGMPFSNVLTESSRNEETASYKITMSYDAVIFDNTIDVVLLVPNQITTRSVTGKPDLDLNNSENSLFEQIQEDE